MTMQDIVSLFTTVTFISSGTTFLAVVLFYFLNHLYKKQIDHIYNVAIENYKANVGLENAKNVETIKANLNIKLEELKSAASLENTKTIETLKSEFTLQNSQNMTQFNKITELSFRDEDVRKSVLINTIQTGDSIRLKLFTDTNRLYFKIMYSHTPIIEMTDQKKQNEEIQKLWEEINALRIDIYSNYIYLGQLIDYLIPAQVGLWDDLGVIRSKIEGTWQRVKGDFNKSSAAIRNAEKWIMENMKTYLTINKVELTKEQIDKLDEEKTRLIAKNAGEGK